MFVEDIIMKRGEEGGKRQHARICRVNIGLGWSEPRSKYSTRYFEARQDTTRPDLTESKMQREREDQRGAGGSIIVKLYL